MELRIIPPDSAVTICVILTNEELANARKSHAAIAEEGKTLRQMSSME